MFNYAQLDENNICIGVSMLSGEVDSINMIQIDYYNNDLVWRKYENGQWSNEKFEPIVEPTISLEDQIKSLKEDNLILMDVLATLFEEILTMKGEV